MFQNIGEMLILFWKSILALPEAWHQRRKISEQLVEVGNSSLLVALVMSFFIGAVFALYTGRELAQVGVVDLVGELVGISMSKELAPVMMAILFAGRVGSSMTSEIGSMKIYQELDALHTMRIDPVVFLVMPRMVAICVALPLVVVFSVFIGWGGGAFICAQDKLIGVNIMDFFHELSSNVELRHVAHGLIKAWVFAAVIGTVSCHQGLTTIGGPRNIGRSVTKAVVNSLVLIIILDFFVTRFLQNIHF